MLNELKTVLSNVMPEADTSEITEKTRLQEDLGFDSLAILMLAMEIEDSFGFKFTEFVKFETVGEVCEYIENHKK